MQRSIFGVPLYSAPEGTIEDGVVWAIAADKVFTVMRQDISVVANPYFYFGAHSTAVRGAMRLGYGFPHEAGSGISTLPWQRRTTTVPGLQRSVPCLLSAPANCHPSRLPRLAARPKGVELGAHWLCSNPPPTQATNPLQSPPLSRLSEIHRASGESPALDLH